MVTGRVEVREGVERTGCSEAEREREKEVRGFAYIHSSPRHRRLLFTLKNSLRLLSLASVDLLSSRLSAQVVESVR